MSKTDKREIEKLERELLALTGKVCAWQDSYFKLENREKKMQEELQQQKEKYALLTTRNNPLDAASRSSEDERR